MATTKLYLDTRSVNAQGLSPLKVCVSNKGASAYIATGIRLKASDWDKKRLQVKHIKGCAEINNNIAAFKLKVDKAIAQLYAEDYMRNAPATVIRDKVLDIIDPKKKQEKLLLYNFRKFIETREADRTKKIYLRSMYKLIDFEPKAEKLCFEDIDHKWLTNFNEWLKESGLTVNGRNIVLRNLKSAFNYAIDNEITQHYPFRKFKLKSERTEKRALTVEQLRKLFNYKATPTYAKYIDLFKLMFFLIGINTKDLCNLKGIDNGYVTYRRAKTGRLYKIKVQPEAMEIMEKYKGTNYLLNILDRYKDYGKFASLANYMLKRVAEKAGLGLPRDNSRTRHTGFSPYWARHTWATVAACLDIPKETIAQALGHGSYDVTDVYISFDKRKIDKANRQVMDFILYNIRSN